jgi:MFS family permease
MKPLHVVLACILVDMIGVGLVIPTLPQLSESLGGTTALYGWVGTAYGIGQLIGGPFCGYLSDRLGRKTILICMVIFDSCIIPYVYLILTLCVSMSCMIVSFCGSCLSYGLMVVAWDFKVLLFCRLIVIPSLHQSSSQSYAICPIIIHDSCHLSSESS